MTVSFDGLISNYKTTYCDRLIQVRYDASTGLYTVNVSNLVTFDLFRDDASVGDWIGFCWTRGVWHDLSLSIATALAGSGITLEWEYSSYNPSTGALTWTALSVTDGTSGLTTSGTVAFAIPDGWRWVDGADLAAGVSASVAGPMIRCRITAATSVSEGGACNARADAKDYAIMVVGSETPASVYAADVAAGWGRVTRAGSHLYACDANLRIGDGATTTTFTISGGDALQVGWYDLTSAYSKNWYRRRTIVAENTGDTWAMGEDVSAIQKNGGALRYCPYGNNYNPFNIWACKIKWYHSDIRWLRGQIGIHAATIGTQPNSNDVKIVSCILDPAGSLFLYSLPVSSLANSLISSSTGYLYVYDNDLVIENISLLESAGVLVGATGVIVRGVTFPTGKVFLLANANVTAYARNCTFAVLASQVSPSQSGDAAAIQYEVEFSVLDSHGQSISGFHVRMVDSSGTVIYSGVYSAAIVATVYTAVNVAGTVTRTTLNPIEIWISKDGYATYYEKISITNDNRKRAITLLHSPTPGRGSMGPDQR